MTGVLIKSFAKFRDEFGAERKIEAPHAATVYDCLILFAGMVPAAQTGLFENGALKSHVVFMYNGERIDTEDASEITVEEGDEIVLYPPVSGG